MLTPAEKLAKQRKLNPVKPTVKVVLNCSLRQLRESLGLTLRDVAEQSNTSTANLSRVERGGQIELSTAMKLAKFFGKSIEEIWSPIC